MVDSLNQRVSNNSYYATVANNVLLNASLKLALMALSKAGIPVIVLKGAALANTIYSDIGLRPMGDIDLLVHQEDRDFSCNVLESAGFQPLPEPERRFTPFNTNLTGEISFLGMVGDIIDLHWELVPIEWLRKLNALDPKNIWQNAQPFQLGDVQALQLAPIDLLLHICVHLASQNYAHPWGYRDIKLILDHYPSFPWDEFTSLSKQYRLRSVSYFALEATAIKLDGAIPDEVLEKLRPPIWQRWLVYTVADPRRGVMGDLYYSHPRSYILHLLIADRLVDVMRVLFWLLFPGRLWLASRYQIRGRIRSWLACIWHPFFTIWQGLLGLLELLKR